MLGQRLRRWINMKPALAQYLLLNVSSYRQIIAVPAYAYTMVRY